MRWRQRRKGRGILLSRLCSSDNRHGEAEGQQGREKAHVSTPQPYLLVLTKMGEGSDWEAGGQDVVEKGCTKVIWVGEVQAWGGGGQALEVFWFGSVDSDRLSLSDPAVERGVRGLPWKMMTKSIRRSDVSFYKYQIHERNRTPHRGAGVSVAILRFIPICAAAASSLTRSPICFFQKTDFFFLIA